MGKIVDGSLLVLAVAAVALWGYSYLPIGDDRPVDPRRATIEDVERKLVGKRLHALSPVKSDEEPDSFFDPSGAVTLLLILRTTCPACERTAPVWKALVDSVPASVRTVVLSDESAQLLADWISTHGVAADVTLAETSTTAWGVIGTPTTLIVDRDGYVVRAKVGRIELGVVPELLMTMEDLVSLKP